MPDDIKKKFLLYLMRKSVPRIIERERRKSKEESIGKESVV